MAHLFVPVAPGGETIAADAWTRRPLETDVQIAPDARLVRARTPDGERWVVLGAPSVRVNGVALGAGIAVLGDRDELYAGGMRMFFSSERPAAVAAFPGGEGATPCARCRTPLAAGTPAVWCPGCGAWHHQADDLPCWTYAARCSLCAQATALDGGLAWTPEGL